MANENLKPLISQGLSAMRAGSDAAARATEEISKDATHPELKAALLEGNQISREWAGRIERASGVAGDGGQGDNPVLEALYEVSRRIRQQAPDDTSRDLGIIASGQIALHYWIAAFGTVAEYSGQVGMTDAARDLNACVQEAKDADGKYTRLARKLLGQD